MTASDPTPLSDRCGDLLGELRADLAARGGRRSPGGMLLAALVRLLETLLRMVADFRAGKLAPLDAGERGEGGTPAARRPAEAEGFAAEDAWTGGGERRDFGASGTGTPGARRRPARCAMPAGTDAATHGDERQDPRLPVAARPIGARGQAGGGPCAGQGRVRAVAHLRRGRRWRYVRYSFRLRFENRSWRLVDSHVHFVAISQ